MSKDRKVSTDALETLGTLIDEYQKRDAIHLAVEPVIAGEPLHPNDDVKIVNGKAYRASRILKEAIGKVDPFLYGRIEPNERFWLVVYPREITSLRHVWSHPAFPEEVLPVAYHEEEVGKYWMPPEPETPPSIIEKENESEKWIRNWVDNEFAIPDDYDDGWGYRKITFDNIMEAARQYVNGEIDYFSTGNHMVYGPPDEFWDHYEILTGSKVPNRKRESFFSCSC